MLGCVVGVVPVLGCVVGLGSAGSIAGLARLPWWGNSARACWRGSGIASVSARLWRWSSALVVHRPILELLQRFGSFFRR